VSYLDDWMLKRINRKRHRLNTSLKEREKVLDILKDLRIEFIHANTALDGSNLTYEDVCTIIETRDSVMDKAKKYQVIALNHLQAQQYLSDPEVKHRALEVKDILEVHRRLTIFADMFAGEFRVNPFNKRDNVTEQMETVLEGIFNGKKRHPIEQGALFYSFFQKVRPFQFGNGLTARVLMKHLINRSGYLFSLKLNEHELKYFMKCEEQAGKGVYRPFVNIVASCTERAFDTVIERLDKPKEKKDEDADMIRFETTIDVDYVFDLVMGNQPKSSGFQQIIKANKGKSLQSMMTELQTEFKEMMEGQEGQEAEN
jgi:fido (protein-threonine AMPylation protein)